jgi:hypothetical protein
LAEDYPKAEVPELTPDRFDWLEPLSTGVLAPGFFDELYPIVEDDRTKVLDSYVRGEDVPALDSDRDDDVKFMVMLDILGGAEFISKERESQILERMLRISALILGDKNPKVNHYDTELLDEEKFHEAISLALDAGMPLSLAFNAALAGYWTCIVRDPMMAGWHKDFRWLKPRLGNEFAEDAKKHGHPKIAAFYVVSTTIGSLIDVARIDDRREREQKFRDVQLDVIDALKLLSETDLGEVYAKVRERLMRITTLFRRTFIETPPAAGTIDAPGKDDRPSVMGKDDTVVVDPKLFEEDKKSEPEPEPEPDPIPLDTRVIHAMDSDEWHYLAATENARKFIDSVVAKWRAVALAESGKEREALKAIPMIINDLAIYWKDRRSALRMGADDVIARDYEHVFAKAWQRMCGEDAERKRQSAKQIDESLLSFYAPGLKDDDEFCLIKAFHAVARAFLLMSASVYGGPAEDIKTARESVKQAKKLLDKLSLPPEIYQMMRWLGQSMEMEVGVVETAQPDEKQVVVEGDEEAVQELEPGEFSDVYATYRLIEVPSLEDVVSGRIRKDEIRKVIEDFVDEYLEPASGEAAFDFKSIMMERGRELEYERMRIQDEVFESLKDRALKNMVLQLWAIDRVVGEIPRGAAHYTRNQQKVLRLIRILALMGWEVKTDEGLLFALDRERKILDRWIVEYEPNKWGELTFAEAKGFDRKKVQRIIENSIGSGDGGGGGGNTSNGPSELTASKTSINNSASLNLRVGLERALGISGSFQPTTMMMGLRYMMNTAGCRV